MLAPTLVTKISNSLIFTTIVLCFLPASPTDSMSVLVLPQKDLQLLVHQHTSFKKALTALQSTNSLNTRHQFIQDSISTLCSTLATCIPALSFEKLESAENYRENQDMLAQSLIRAYNQGSSAPWKEYAWAENYKNLEANLKEKQEGLLPDSTVVPDVEKAVEFSLSYNQSNLVSVQNFIIDLLLNMVVVSGQQYASLLFNQQEQQEDAQLNQKIKDLQTEFKATQSSLTQQTQAAIKALETQFSTQLDTIQKTTTAAQEQFLKQVQYTQRLVNLTVPAQQFLTDDRMNIDVLFGSSAMLTPNNGTTWYNVFGRSYTALQDWQYDTDFQAFAQRGSVGAQPASLMSNLSQQWLDDQNKINPAVAEFNQIFTEYYTNQASYTIKVQVTLINCSYPFCAGIIFNKARWISGSPDRMYSYRFVGLYGTKPDKNPRIGLYGGQTISTQIGGIALPTTPLSAIVSGTNLPLYTLPAAITEKIGQDPITFIITLVVQEATVTVMLEEVTSGTGTGAKTLFSSPLAELDAQESQLLFWYHGIGFMAPGCQALFKILQPTELAYTADQVQAFASTLKQSSTQ